jgi:hypothetical protein
MAAITAGAWRMPPGVGKGAADLITKLLRPDPDARLGPTLVLQHPWIVRHCGTGRAFAAAGAGAAGAAADALVTATGLCVAPWDNLRSALVKQPHQVGLTSALHAFEAREGELARGGIAPLPLADCLQQRFTAMTAAGLVPEVAAAAAAAAQGAACGTEARGLDVDVLGALAEAAADGVLPAGVIEDMERLLGLALPAPHLHAATTGGRPRSGQGLAGVAAPPSAFRSASRRPRTELALTNPREAAAAQTLSPPALLPLGSATPNRHRSAAAGGVAGAAGAAGGTPEMMRRVLTPGRRAARVPTAAALPVDGCAATAGVAAGGGLAYGSGGLTAAGIGENGAAATPGRNVGGRTPAKRVAPPQLPASLLEGL